MTGPKFAVRCPEYTTKPVWGRESAERLLARIEADGKCKEQHEIVEVER